MATPTSLSYAGNLAAASLTADGTVVTIGPLSVTIAGHDLASSQAECQLGRGSGSVPSGSTDFGFSDATYVMTAAQLLAGSLAGA